MDMLELLLLIAGAAAAAAIAFFAGQFLKNLEWEKKVDDIRADAIKKSRAVLGGQFSEQLAPYLPDFPYSPTEVRFIGKPIDFIVFKGMDQKEISEVIFVEVKSGKSALTRHERILRDAIIGKKMSWAEYRIPRGITDEKNEGQG
ncbi:MAG: Holliday junction resolvase-like protein [Candidatus Micrarchaeota archaeon]